MIVRQRGFTLVELITVMILLGILAAVAIPRMMGNTGMASTSFRADVVSALRYAQKTAVSHRRLVCATVSTNVVALAIASGNPATDCNEPFASPDGTPYASRDAAIVAGGLLGKLFFQPNGTITNANGVVSGSITVTNEGAVRLDGLTGHVE